MGELLKDLENENIKNKIKFFVKEMCEKYPIYNN